MDYHAWMVLMRSSGVLEYGSDFYRELAGPADSIRKNKPGELAGRIWGWFTARFSSHPKPSLQTAPASNNPCCQG